MIAQRLETAMTPANFHDLIIVPGLACLSLAAFRTFSIFRG